MTIDVALQHLIPGLQRIYGDLIHSIILYGSTARGNFATLWRNKRYAHANAGFGCGPGARLRKGPIGSLH